MDKTIKYVKMFFCFAIFLESKHFPIEIFSNGNYFCVLYDKLYFVAKIET